MAGEGEGAGKHVSDQEEEDEETKLELGPQCSLKDQLEKDKVCICCLQLNVGKKKCK